MLITTRTPGTQSANVAPLFPQARVHTDPFPYFTCRNAICESSAAGLLGALPPDNAYEWSRGNGLRGTFTFAPENLRRLAPWTRTLWTRFRETFLADHVAPQILRLFGDTIDADFYAIRAGHNRFNAFSSLKLIRDLPGYVHPIHVDHTSVIATLLIYLSGDRSPAHLGTELYTSVAADFECNGGVHYAAEKFRLQRSVPYTFGTALGMLATPRSFHGINNGQPIDERRDLLALSIRIDKSRPWWFQKHYRKRRGRFSASFVPADSSS